MHSLEPRPLDLKQLYQRLKSGLQKDIVLTKTGFTHLATVVASESAFLVQLRPSKQKKPAKFC